MTKLIKAFASVCMLLLCWNARADITIGAVLSTTGPGASLGIPEKNTIELMTSPIAGQNVRFVILDDASNTTTAVKSAQRLVDENKVDVIVGPTLTPSSLALLDVVGSGETPMISLAGGDGIVEPTEGNRRWAFKLTPQQRVMGARIFDHVQKNGGKTVAYIMVANSFGEEFTSGVNQVAIAKGIKTVATERYNPTDLTVLAQVLRVLATNPDAVVVSSFGTPAALPVRELRQRGYKGPIYLPQGVANNDFIRVGGADVNGCYITVAPALVAEQLRDSDPIRKPAMEFVSAYETKFGPGSRSLFGATAWDAMLLVRAAVPGALKVAAPGTPAFRKALRDEMENVKNLMASSGVYNMTPKDHIGTDDRAQVLVKIENGKWVLVQ